MHVSVAQMTGYMWDSQALSTVVRIKGEHLGVALRTKYQCCVMFSRVLGLSPLYSHDFFSAMVETEGSSQASRPFTCDVCSLIGIRNHYYNMGRRLISGRGPGPGHGRPARQGLDEACAELYKACRHLPSVTSMSRDVTLH